jgi:predicted RNA-binding Zn ribbon-like protein
VVAVTSGVAAPDQIDLVSGWLCLDFANTVEPRWGPAERDHLHRYGDLVAWAHHAGALDDDAHAGELLRASTERPAPARAHFSRAIELREAVYEVFAAVARDETPPAAHLAVVQRWYAAAARNATIVATGAGFTWVWPRADLDRPLYAVARSALEMLMTGPLERLKMCPTDVGCGWLFVDTTKNRSRRWCSMHTCGAEVKIKRQTARRRATRARG